MNKEEFIKTLQETDIPQETKLEVCNYFITNYPVKIITGVNPFTGVPHYTWTALQGYNITNGSEDMVNQAFLSLQGRVKELEEYV